MIKKRKLLLLISTSIVLFLGGFVTGKIVYEKPTREVLIGFENPNYEGRIDFPKIITDVEDQWTIDNLQQILMFSKQVDIDNISRESADVHILIKSPKAFVSLIHAEIWFSDEGALMKLGEDDYRKIGLEDTDAIKQMIEFEGS